MASDITNYRPISPLPVVSKLLELHISSYQNISQYNATVMSNDFHIAIAHFIALSSYGFVLDTIFLIAHIHVQ